MTTDNTIFRTTKDKNNPYVMINKIGMEDTRLSWKARGILAYLLSKPDNWKVNLEHLKKQAPDGKTSLRSGIDELKKYGYLIRVAIRKNKKIEKWQFWVNETPISNPVEKQIHVDAEVLEEFDKQDRSLYLYTTEGKFLDNTLLTENRKVGKTLDTSLVTENLKVGNLDVGNQDVGNGKLLNNELLNNELLSNDIDDDAERIPEKWESDSLYRSFRDIFAQAGAADIKKHDEHYNKFLNAVNNIGFGNLILSAEKYIESQGKSAQIVYFLTGHYNQYLQKEKTKTASKKRSRKVSKLPASFQQQNAQDKINEEQETVILDQNNHIDNDAFINEFGTNDLIPPHVLEASKTDPMAVYNWMEATRHKVVNS
jgi:hypothetical protein